jgi:hypothetical protein
VRIAAIIGPTPRMASLSGVHLDLRGQVKQAVELALLTVRQGDPRTHVIRWDIEPHAVLNSLARDIPLVEDSPKGAYEIVVSRDILSLFQIFSVHVD